MPVVYAALSAAAAASVAGMRTIAEMPWERQQPGEAGVGAALREVAAAHADPKLLLMAPTNAAFGLCTALFPYTVTIMAAGVVGPEGVSWLYALSGARSLPFSRSRAAIRRSSRDAAAAAQGW